MAARKICPACLLRLAAVIVVCRRRWNRHRRKAAARAASALSVRHGHISKQGSAWLRWVLNQAAQTAKRSPEFSATYAAIARRRGKKIATIAISRKLLTRAYHLLTAVQAAQATSTPDTTGHGPTDQRTVAKPRARSLQRHEPA